MIEAAIAGVYLGVKLLVAGFIVWLGAVLFLLAINNTDRWWPW